MSTHKIPYDPQLIQAIDNVLGNNTQSEDVLKAISDQLVPACTVAMVGVAGMRILTGYPIDALNAIPIGAPLYTLREIARSGEVKYPLDSNELFEMLFGLLEGDVPEQLTDDVLQKLADQLNTVCPRPGVTT